MSENYTPYNPYSADDNAYVPYTYNAFKAAKAYTISDDPKDPTKYVLTLTPLTDLKITKGYDRCPARKTLNKLHKNWTTLKTEERATYFKQAMAEIQATTNELKKPYFFAQKIKKQDSLNDWLLDKQLQSNRTEARELLEGILALSNHPDYDYLVHLSETEVTRLYNKRRIYDIDEPTPTTINIAETCIVDATLAPSNSQSEYDDGMVDYFTPSASPDHADRKCTASYTYHTHTTVLSTRQTRSFITFAQKVLVAYQVIYAECLNQLSDEPVFGHLLPIAQELEANELGMDYNDYYQQHCEEEGIF